MFQEVNSRLTSPFAVPVNLGACRLRPAYVNFEVHLGFDIVKRFLDLNQNDDLQDLLMPSVPA